jgi:AraC-like DNA-binding protein
MHAEPARPGAASTAPLIAAGRHQLSTTAVPQGQRLGWWLDLIGSMYVQLDIDPPTDTDIFGDIQFRRIGDIDVSHLRSNGRRLRRTPERIRQSTEDHCLVLIQREGRGALVQDGRTGILNPGDFLLNDCTRPYELCFDGPHHDLYVLRLPRATLAGHVANLEELCATTVSGQAGAGHLLLNMVETLNREASGLHPASALGVSEAITQVIGAGLRSLPGANVRKASSLAAFHVARVREHVQRHLRDPDLSVASVARAVQLSPDHLSRLFRAEPLPLSRLIWVQRLDACRRDLADVRLAERSVSELAFSWGFNDAAHFSRSFREQFGLSPRAWRAQALPGDAAPPDAQD